MQTKELLHYEKKTYISKDWSTNVLGHDRSKHREGGYSI